MKQKHLTQGNNFPKGEAELCAEEQVAEGEALVAVGELSKVEAQLSAGVALAKVEALVANDGLSQEKGQGPLE